MHNVKYLLFILILLQIIACTSVKKKKFIKQFDVFIIGVETNYKTYNENDWKEADLIYNNLIDIEYAKYRTSLTDAENSHVNILIGKYKGLKLKTSLFSIKDQLRNVIQQRTTMIDEIVSDITLIK